MQTYRVIAFWPEHGEVWKGLTPEGVRETIEGERPRKPIRLRVYREGSTPDGWATYTEIPAEQWDALFFTADERLKANGQLIETTNADQGNPMHEFRQWPKTARLFRDITITEKLDGCNVAVHISTLTGGWEDYPPESYSLVVDGVRYVVSAQSRNRMVYPGKTTDHFGFAAWVYDNARELVRLLGEGVHYGEWWGRGIQRGYGLEERRFSLFNTDRYAGTEALFASVSGNVRVNTVPVLYQGPNDTAEVAAQLALLSKYGSRAVPGWPTPEGLCVYHSATRTVTKATLDNQDAGKWEVA